MTDQIDRLNAALEGRYAIERELGEGRYGYGLPGRRPQALAQGRAEGAEAGVGGRRRSRTVPG